MGLTCRNCRVSHLWSVVYGVLAVTALAYLSAEAVRRYIQLNGADWRNLESPKPESELIALVICAATSLLMLPLLLITAVLDVGIWAGSGHKLGRDDVRPEVILNVGEATQMPRRLLWKLFWPPSQLVHVISATLLVLSRYMLDTALVKHRLVPDELTWTSDITMWGHHDTSALGNTTLALQGVSVGVLRPLPLDTLTLAFGFIALAVRYSSITWYTHRAFSALICLHALVSAAEQLLSLVAFQVVAKASASGESSIQMTGAQLLPFLIISNGFIFASSFASMKFGFDNYYKKYMAYMRRVHPVLVKKSIKKNAWCQDYMPHIMATVCVVVGLALKSPVLRDFVQAYRSQSNTTVLTALVAEVIFFVFWTALWLGFTVKHTWRFRVEKTVSCGNHSSVTSTHLSSGTQTSFRTFSSSGVSSALSEQLVSRSIASSTASQQVLLGPSVSGIRSQADGAAKPEDTRIKDRRRVAFALDDYGATTQQTIPIIHAAPSHAVDKKNGNERVTRPTENTDEISRDTTHSNETLPNAPDANNNGIVVQEGNPVVRQESLQGTTPVTAPDPVYTPVIRHKPIPAARKSRPILPPVPENSELVSANVFDNPSYITTDDTDSSPPKLPPRRPLQSFGHPAANMAQRSVDNRPSPPQPLEWQRPSFENDYQPYDFAGGSAYQLPNTHLYTHRSSRSTPLLTNGLLVNLTNRPAPAAYYGNNNLPLRSIPHQWSSRSVSVDDASLMASAV